jgi:transcription elongation factor Elf1
MKVLRSNDVNDSSWSSTQTCSRCDSKLKIEETDLTPSTGTTRSCWFTCPVCGRKNPVLVPTRIFDRVADKATKTRVME